MNYLAGDLFCGCGGMATGSINALARRGGDAGYEGYKSAIETIRYEHGIRQQDEEDYNGK